MDLSIIIVNYKTPELTKKCVDSIKKYPPKFKYEVIVIDNTFDNVGFARGNNKGIRKSKGKYILLLNSDTEVKKNSIDKLVEFAKSHPDAGVVASRLLSPDGSIQPSVYRFPTVWRAMRQYWFGEKNLLDKYIPDTPTVEVAVMASFLITHKCLAKVGLLNEKYFMYFEDFDYCRKIKESGLKIYYNSESEVIHHHGASGKTLATDENQWKRLIPGSIIYHGIVKHYILYFILWTGQKYIILRKKYF